MQAPGIRLVEEQTRKERGDTLRADVVGLAGVFERGPILAPTRVEDWGEARGVFGGFFRIPGERRRMALGPLALYNHFQNGGGTAVVVRLSSRWRTEGGSEEGARPSYGLFPDPATGALVGVLASSVGAWGDRIRIRMPIRVQARVRVPGGFPSNAPTVTSQLEPGQFVRYAQSAPEPLLGGPFGRIYRRSDGKLAVTTQGALPAGDAVVEVIDPNVTVSIDGPEGTERHRDLTLAWEDPRGVWRHFEVSNVEGRREEHSLPPSWGEPEGLMKLSLARQAPAASKYVRIVLPAGYPREWSGVENLPTLSLGDDWPSSSVALATAQSTTSRELSLELENGGGDLGALSSEVFEEGIRVLARHPAPSVVCVPDLMLSLAPEVATCDRRPHPFPRLEPEPAPADPCPEPPRWECEAEAESERSGGAEPSSTEPGPGAASASGRESELPRLSAAEVALLQETQVAELTANADTAGDRVVLLDALPGLTPEEAVLESDRLRRRGELSSNRGNGRPEALAGLLYPWLRILDPLDPSGPPLLVPPSAHVAGVMARTTREGNPGSRFANLPLRGVVGVERELSEETRSVLHFGRVCALHLLRGSGIHVRGVRTLAISRPGEGFPSDLFLPSTRVVAYLRRVLRVLGSTLVFEPNAERLWMRIRFTLESVLGSLHRQNVLVGRTREEAYRVRCDESTTTPEDRELGRVVARVDFAPAIPLEFVTIRVGFSRDGSAIVEDFRAGGS